MSDSKDIVVSDDDSVMEESSDSDQQSSFADDSQKSSAAWQFFTRVVNPQTNSVTHVNCSLCSGRFKFNKTGTTSNMIKHLNRRHSDTAEVRSAGLITDKTSGKKRKIGSYTYTYIIMTTGGTYIIIIIITRHHDHIKFLTYIPHCLPRDCITVVHHDVGNPSLSHSSNIVTKASINRFLVPVPRAIISADMEKRISTLLLKLSCEMNLPFRSLSNSTYFKEMMSLLAPGYVVPSRKKIRSLLDIHYKDIVDRIITQVRSVDSIALTTDSTVLNGQGLPYVVITGHFINSDWKLNNIIMGVVLSDQQQETYYLCHAIDMTLKNFEVGAKIQCIVTDEGSAFLKSMKTLKETKVIKESLRCVCHRLHIAVKYGISKSSRLKLLIDHCQTIVKKFRNSFTSKKKDILHNCQHNYLQTLLDRIKVSPSDLVLREKHDRLSAELTMEKMTMQRKASERKEWNSKWSISDDDADNDSDSDSGSDVDADETDIADEEKAENAIMDSDSLLSADDMKLDEKVKTLKLIDTIKDKKALMLNVVTRWNSSIVMVKRVVSWREAINLALLATEKDPEAYNKHKITDDDARLLEQFIEVTESLYDGTIELQASSTPSLSSSMYWYFSIYFGMQQSAANRRYDPIIQEFCKAVEKKLGAKFEFDKDTVMVLATMLDPRFKNLVILNHVPERQNLLWSILLQEYTIFSSELNVMSAASSGVSSSSTEIKPPSALQKALSRVGLKIDIDSEINRYKTIPAVAESVNPLEWWRLNGDEFPILSRMAKRYLAIPASSAASERAWSVLGNIFTKRRNRLASETLCKLLMVKHNQTVVP